MKYELLHLKFVIPKRLKLKLQNMAILDLEQLHTDVLLVFFLCVCLCRQLHFAYNNKLVLLCVYRNTPDPAQETQGSGYSKPIVEALSAVCVRSPHYGTRSVSLGSRQGSALADESLSHAGSGQWVVK